MATNTNHKRANRVPPHVSLATLRRVSGMTLSEVCGRVNQYLGEESKVRPGTISGLELGYRGASRRLLDALEYAYNLEPGSITTDYLPRKPRTLEAAV